MLRAAALAALLVLATSSAALADACTPTTTTPELDIVGVLYVVDDCKGSDGNPPHDHCLMPWGGKWVYQESNGIAGLQRRDEVVDDTCGGSIAGDSILL